MTKSEIDRLSEALRKIDTQELVKTLRTASEKLRKLAGALQNTDPYYSCTCTDCTNNTDGVCNNNVLLTPSEYQVMPCCYQDKPELYKAFDAGFEAGVKAVGRCRQ